MEILRVQPYSNITIPFTVPGSFTQDTDFLVTITDMADLSFSQTTYTGSSGDVLSFVLPGSYDASYRIEVLPEGQGMQSVLDETYELVRPYVDPATKGQIASEIAEYSKNEEIARAIIDSVIPEGFYLKKKVLDTTGLGADYVSLWDRALKVLKLYENNVLVFDAASPETSRTLYGISEDKTAIVEKVDTRFNRAESANIIIPAAPSDYVDLTHFYFRGFPKSHDFRAVLEVGYYQVPADIVRATEILVDDLSCGRLDYYKKYVSDYSTDQFKLKFDSMVFEGTGNIIVDKILSKYAKSIRKLGVL